MTKGETMTKTKTKKKTNRETKADWRLEPPAPALCLLLKEEFNNIKKTGNASTLSEISS